MAPEKFLSNRMTLTISLLSLCALVLVAGAARKSGNGQDKKNRGPNMQESIPQVENKTRSFAITQARRNLDVIDAGPELSLTNGYERSITAFAVSVNGLIIMSDFAYSENEGQRAIAPGAVYTSGFGSVRRSANTAIAAQENFDIKILAVLFDDKSSEGDEEGIGFLLDHRLKSKRILRRIVNLLNETIDQLGTTNSNAAADLKPRISSLTNNPDDASDINDVLRWLDQSNPRLSTNARIAGVKEICENLIARL